MSSIKPRDAAVYFVFGALLGAFSGVILGLVLFGGTPRVIVVTVAISALVLGILGVLFKENVVAFLAWLEWH